MWPKIMPGSSTFHAGACAYVNTGIDHCAWFTQFLVNVRPAMEQLKEMGIDEWLAMPPEQAEQDATFADLFRLRCGIMIGQNLNVLPAIGDRHMFEFLPGFLNDPKAMKQYDGTDIGCGPGERTGDSQDRLSRLIRDDESVTLPGSSDDVAAWIAALNAGPPVEDNLNAPNIGQIPQLPEGAVVETRGVLDASGLRPLVSPMPPEIEAIVRPHALRAELTVDAALEGDFDKALAAMMSDPLLKSGDLARPMLKELVAANQPWLPQF